MKKADMRIQLPSVNLYIKKIYYKSMKSDKHLTIKTGYLTFFYLKRVIRKIA